MLFGMYLLIFYLLNIIGRRTKKHNKLKKPLPPLPPNLLGDPRIIITTPQQS